MKNKKWLMAAVLPAVLCLWAGCKTTVPVTYTEPARLNLSGVNRIAVDSEDSRAAASVSQQITATGKYTVASAAELAEWKQWKIERQEMEELAAYQGRAIEVSAAELVNAYSGNAVRADSSYLDKTLKVTAVVKEIGITGESYFVRLEGAGNDSVDVFFVSSGGLAAVDKGQTIAVIGECRGYTRPDLKDTAEILRILGAGRSVNIINATFPVEGLKDYPGAVDAVISLDVNSSVQEDSHDERRVVGTGADGKPVYGSVKIYDRTVTVNVGYQVVRAGNGSLIGEGTKSTASTDSNADASKWEPLADMVARIINGPLNEFAGEIVPTQRSISITLAKESENKGAKKEMSGAEKLAKEKNYGDAAEAYGRIYAGYKNFAAGYNHAVLTEAAAGTEAAVELMEALSQETGNAMARSTLADMRKRIAGNQEAAAQLSQ